MTVGALILAFNNEQTDYVGMAAWSAENIRRHLKIPVAIVTNAIYDKRVDRFFDRVIPAEPESGGRRTFADCDQACTWFNASRVDAYRLTPWDRTLLLDADYVVASNSLLSIIDSPEDFLAHQTAVDATGLNDFSGLNYFGAYHMPMWWATVVMFRRSKSVRLIFESMQMIKENWMHYRHLYHSGNSVYRNDHALSIALGIVNGHTLTYPSIPWNLVSVLPEHQLTQLSLDHYRIDYVNAQNRRCWIDLKDQDFHAMGKRHLGDIVAASFA